MAQKATEIYLSHPEILNDHIQAEITSGNPFDFPGLEIVKSAQESRAIHEVDGPKVIIAGSGMMVGGRIVGHAGYYLDKPSTRLLIVGYQGEGTLGRELLEGAKEVVVNGEPVSVAATISSTRAMSSHADQDQLLTWLKSIHNVRHLCLTHGEDGPRAALAELVKQEVGITQVTLPTLNQTVTL
jgi:metallo-beta-lactamase family protein